jgi:tRNA pseudouridine38-40 synthase
MRTRYFIHCAYEGTAYHGWQRQQNALAVQEVMEKSLLTLTSGQIKELTGAGRTDTGVHASKYFAHFDSPYRIEQPEIFARKLNGILPDDIAVYDVFEVPEDAHARFSATARRYHYRIISGKNPFENRWACRFHQKLDLNAIQSATALLIGKKDFGCFAKSHHGAENTTCEVFEAAWQMEKDVLIFDIRANRFLRNMVRAITGTLLDIGIGKLEPLALKDILASKDRREAGVSVPPQGLFLVDIEYPEDLIADRQTLKKT